MAKKEELHWLLIPAGLLIGLGVGLAVDLTASGVITGLGVGFLGAFVAASMKK